MKNPPNPRAGVDYPRNLREFDLWFADESACRNYIFRIRWPEGYECLQCRSKKPPWITARNYLHCRECGTQISILAGTLFERTRTSLRVWFQAIWLVTSQKHGASAPGLQRVLGLGSYQTAWCWLHKLRYAMVRPGGERLHGSVEVDETYVGGEETGGKRGRGAGKKEIVVIAVEVLHPKGFGRIRMRRIADVSGDSLVTFICDVVEPGAKILTDGWGGYNGLTKHSYMHSRTVLSHSGDPAHVAMPAVQHKDIGNS